MKDKLPVYFFDPVANDRESKIRGIGRYVESLYDCFADSCHFVSDVKEVPFNSIFINPFFDLFKKPLTYRRIAKIQIAVIHDLTPLIYWEKFPVGIKGRLTELLNRYLIHKTYDNIITDSKSSKRSIVDMIGLNKDNVQIIYPMVTNTFLTHLSSVKNEKPKTFPQLESFTSPPQYCLYVGDVTWNKNIVNIAKAIKIANVHCVFSGKHFIRSKMNKFLINKKKFYNPWLEELFSFYQEIENDKRFILAGFTSDKDLIKLYRNAECNLLLSRSEGFGYPFAESGICKTPSILSNISVFREIAHDNAIFADPEDPLSISDAIKSIFNDKEKRKIYSQKAYDRACHFNKNEFKSQFFSIIQELLKKL